MTGVLTGGGIISSNKFFPLKLTAAMRTLKDAHHVYIYMYVWYTKCIYTMGSG